MIPEVFTPFHKGRLLPPETAATGLCVRCWYMWLPLKPSGTQCDSNKYSTTMWQFTSLLALGTGTDLSWRLLSEFKLSTLQLTWKTEESLTWNKICATLTGGSYLLPYSTWPNIKLFTNIIFWKKYHIFSKKGNKTVSTKRFLLYLATTFTFIIQAFSTYSLFS